MKNMTIMRAAIMAVMKVVMEVTVVVVMADMVATVVVDTDMDTKVMSTVITDTMQDTITNGDTTKEVNMRDMADTIREDTEVVTINDVIPGLFTVEYEMAGNDMCLP